MKKEKSIVVLIVTVLLILLSGCNAIKSTTKDLEEAGYSISNNRGVFLNPSDYLDDDSFESQYTVTDEEGNFAALLIEFSSKNSAKLYYGNQDYEESSEQKVILYKNLIIAMAGNNDVLSVITGEDK